MARLRFTSFITLSFAMPWYSESSRWRTHSGLPAEPRRYSRL